MIVNSLNFLFFFVIVFIVYYLPILRNNPKFQNKWLFLTSYFFYGITDWKMIPLLFGTTIVFFLIGKLLKKEISQQNKKRASNITTTGVIVGICILLYFKYLNFFAESFAQLFNTFGLHVTWTTLNIVLPIGVSFFTFKLISYIIEIHRGHIEPCKNFIEFGTYVAFFPTILSGPIDRPNIFIPQLQKTRLFNYSLAVNGCRQILWGMLTKMCIADNIAYITNSVWASYSEQTGSTLLLTACLYLIQMYADFDGYSNMAIGVSKILGFNIARNFNHPLLARNIAEYWSRWHISLTSWITDYVFMPLNIAFRDWGKIGIIIAIMINLIIIGLWHGSNWTYGLFGIYHGLLYVPLIVSGSFGRKKKLKATAIGLPLGKDFMKMISTFLLVSLGLIIFRAQSIYEAEQYFMSIITNPFFPLFFPFKRVIPFIILLFLLEWVQRDEEHTLVFTIYKRYNNIVYRWVIYIIIIIITYFCQGEYSNYIYFNF